MAHVIGAYIFLLLFVRKKRPFFLDKLVELYKIGINQITIRSHAIVLQSIHGYLVRNFKVFIRMNEQNTSVFSLLLRMRRLFSFRVDMESNLRNVIIATRMEKLKLNKKNIEVLFYC